MKTPTTRSEFERNFHLLKELQRGDRLRFASHLVSTMESLERVWRLPNGRIDFLSVDERARLQANTMAQLMTNRDAEEPELTDAEATEGVVDVRRS